MYNLACKSENSIEMMAGKKTIEIKSYNGDNDKLHKNSIATV